MNANIWEKQLISYKWTLAITNSQKKKKCKSGKERDNHELDNIDINAWFSFLRDRSEEIMNGITNDVLQWNDDEKFAICIQIGNHFIIISIVDSPV